MDIPSHLTLSTNVSRVGSKQSPSKGHIEAVIAVPKAVTGLERGYLEALRENVTARQDYDTLLEKSAQQPSSLRVDARGTRLSEHVELLRLKRRNEELHILKHYMMKLKDTAPAKPDFLDFTTYPRHELDFYSSAYPHACTSDDQADDSVATVMRQLEVAVISAQYQVTREHRLLAEVEQDVVAVPASVKEKNRSHALAATRNELVAWIEEKLSSSQSSDKGTVDHSLHGEQTASTISQIESEIMEKYDDYLKMRRRILDLISDITKSTQRPPPEAQRSDIQQDSPNQPAQPPTPSQLPFIRTQIQHPTQLHQFHRQQSTYLANLVKQEHNKTTSELSRLADESHILPTYPMLSQQNRLSHTTAGITSNSLAGDGMVSDEADEVNRRMKAWAFAADASGKAVKEIMDKHLERGGEAIEEGKRWVKRLRELAGDDNELGPQLSGKGSRDDDKDDGEEDVWALEAAVGSLASRKRTLKGSKDPWAGFQGDVGL
ncbi:hypothetical protein GJ744_007886 [Endocarpon pusillum]|uniref:Uncharacterized protein n=1 Tax=Endocarpon pusillum TaxID=364733 RepID=A0A8H7E793_9EURO|nr:hypothetical protein GJ744_007886 [Endocarpon pusillum]